MLSNYDHAVVIFYFVLMFAVGFVFRAVNRNSSDYFRGSGSMLWWVVGASAFMQQISAFTFTGMAGKAYIDGSIVVVVFFANACAYLVNYLWSARRFRQLRLITPIEGVRERFGTGNEQFFTWLQMPVNVIAAGIWLNGLGIFVASVFQIDLTITIVGTGLVVLLMSVLGGSWAVIASDFVQMLVLMIITVVAGALMLGHPAIGGVSGFIEKSPAVYFDWTSGARPAIIWLWVLGSFTKQMFGLNNLMDASRYLCARDGDHASRGALFAAGLMFLGPLIWFIPPMAAGILAPDLGAVFPGLKNPGDAAYVFGAAQVLPLGMMGLLLCGIFAATMSSMDSALNRNAGIFVKNFYQPVLAPAAAERKLLAVGKSTSLVLGLVIIVVSQFLSQLEEFSLFDMMLLFGGLVALPSMIPLTLGVVVRRTPGWSGWSTTLVGFAVSWYVSFGIDPQAFGRWMGFASEMSPREVNDFRFFAGVLGNVIICTAWFLGTGLFYRRASEAHKKRVEAMFERMRTPVDYGTEIGGSHARQQYLSLGAMCGLFAAFMLVVGLLVPQEAWTGRLAYLAVIGGLGVIGLLLWRKGREEPDAETLPESATPYSSVRTEDVRNRTGPVKRLGDQ